MAEEATYGDRPRRDGGVIDPKDDQLDAATADGAPTPGGEPLDSETADFALGGGAVEAELAAERDRNLRLRAELENVRTRSARENAENLKYASLSLVRDLLPVLDNIDRALEAAAKANEVGPLTEGVRLVRQQLLTVLGQYHVQEIPAQGEAFDPQFHAAILQQPSADVPASHVMMVAQTGYKLHDRVVRPSQVIVSSGAG
ncbi:MAG TPA: nucleotide exchange factor GrpE [Lacipirellula sp.]